jgi:hypothetical protein
VCRLARFTVEIPPLQPGEGYAKSEMMPTEPTPPKPPADDSTRDSSAERKPSPAAERALAEAAARRAAREAKAAEQRKEFNGGDGPEPTRYGDWEKDGLASDF